MKKPVVLDVEATIHAQGNPFSQSNRLMCVGTLVDDEYRYHDIEHSGDPYGRNLEEVRRILEQAEYLVGFNIKYDLHWIRRYIPDIRFPPVWDCQLAEFLLHDQRNPYPSLDFAAKLYSVGAKSVWIDETYWKLGIDTDKIPREELEQYNKDDCLLTKGVWEKQKTLLEEQGKLALFRTQCADLLTLQEMEFNGIGYDAERCNGLARETGELISKVERELNLLVNCPDINWNSPNHLSAILYGGKIPYPGMETVTRVSKKGKVRVYERKCVKYHEFPRLVEPLDRTRTKDSDDSNPIYYTNEDVLRSLKARGNARRIINLVLEQSELEKLRGTYYEGLPKLAEEKGWEPGVLHGQFNQCVARTGRLSSSQPNLQNFASAIKPIFKPRNGLFINTDAKGLEWVCAAYLSRDQVAREELLAGLDHHAINQQRFKLPSRLIAKTFMFRLIYGGSAWSYANDPDFSTLSGRESFWQEIIDEAYSKYKGLGSWHVALVRQVVDSGKLVMPTGRVYRFEKIRGEYPRTQILNYPVQGFGADLLSIIRVSLYKRMRKAGLQSQLVSTIHDSILIDAFDNEKDSIVKLISDVFEDMPGNFERVFGVKFDLPLKCETSVGTNWGVMEVVN